MYNTKAYSAVSATAPLASDTITRRDPTEHDVQIEILFCGICHSDLNLLRLDGNITLVAAPEKPLEVAAFSLIMARRILCGSNIGGIAETQEMLDFCGEHNITADVEAIPIQKVNEAYERLLKSDVKYRFCIDMASLKSE
jgi:D-arabinose 1-dehydrogenase-like Zn-dependent alcohol dehydrogenase